MSHDMMKQRAAYLAAQWVKDDMLVGIGTGSTTQFFIDALSKRCHQGLRINAVCSSVASYARAKKENIPLIDDHQVTAIDMTFDGADEIDAQKRMIKGGGGALTREKILANASREMVVLVDETKKVAQLGGEKLPVEILSFAHVATIAKIRTLGFRGELRLHSDGRPFQTDNGNLIYDIEFQKPRSTPEKDHERLIHIPGVVETGYFFNLAGRVLIGMSSGEVEVWEH